MRASASMRPQHITAENAERRTGEREGGGSFNEAAAYHCGKRRHGAELRSLGAARFNEAAAYHCGKHQLVDQVDRECNASMRPQHITAENSARRVSTARS